MQSGVKHTFTAHDSLIDLVEEDFNILPILSRFSIPLGVGNKTIGEVCSEAGIDSRIFLLLVNYILSGVLPVDEPKAESAISIVDFLHNSHDYFLGYKFPHIRKNLIEALDPSHSDINPAIIQFFDDYVMQVKNHFDYEEQYVWPYIRSLSSNTHPAYSIDVFRQHHDEISDKLNDLKNIILRYYTTSMPDRMYDVLVDIFNCEEDLNTHHTIENHILVPMVESLESNGLQGE
ncbi:MAG: hemerythrin domain-containing protein [Firmicutes bacterium]|nr:hemerythrin domain-containing protein [Bacillota bacterium]MCM1401889.1 hemerythrin domain-containing protein [Bacteroides sp.]MCM1477891.1 hemerythrin domain-containing protein [Bacteroides sp.]